MSTRSISLLMGAGLVCLLLLAAFVWPTPYRYETWYAGQDPVTTRTNRLTGLFAKRHAGQWTNDPWPYWRLTPQPRFTQAQSGWEN